MSTLVILNLQPFEYRAKFEKNPSISKIGILTFFKRLCKESFENLELNSN